MAKCLRCGADSAWIQGRVPPEVAADQDRLSALTEENAKLKDVIKAIKSCEWFNEDDLDNTDNPFTMVGCNSLRKAFALLDK